MTDDLALLARWRDGDKQAGDELFRRHLETLHRFFQNKVSGNVDDLIQQTMLACLEGHQRFEQRASFRSYMLGVARYNLFEYYRRTKFSNERFELATSTVHDMGQSPSAQLARTSEERLLLEGLRRLPVDLQIALELSYWDGLTGPELAEVLEIPLDTAYSRLRRAKDLLRGQLSRLADSPERLAQTQTDLDQWATSLRRRVSEASEE